jgi:uncharacterized protein
MIARAMTTQAMTDAIEPLRLARKEAVWEGEIPLGTLPRLAAEVVGADGDQNSDVAVSLHFFRDAEGRARVRGTVSLAVSLSCQRCLEPVVRGIDIELDLWLTSTQRQLEELSPEHEPYMLASDHVSVAELIEDDLLLALPYQVCPDFDACPNAPSLTFPAAAAVAGENARVNPFDALAHLKKRP